MSSVYAEDEQFLDNFSEAAKDSTAARSVECEFAMACQAPGLPMVFGIGITIEDQQVPLFLSADLLRDLADRVDRYEIKRKQESKRAFR